MMSSGTSLPRLVLQLTVALTSATNTTFNTVEVTDQYVTSRPHLSLSTAPPMISMQNFLEMSHSAACDSIKLTLS
eukprot:5318307-Ditylum_brightwellii.AAC.1